MLFDPLQLDLEQYVLSDVCAAFFVLTALVILVWRGNRAGWVAMSAAGLLLITVLSGWRSPPAPGAGPRVPSATVPSGTGRG